jgi:hypothetical protein
LGAIQKHVKKLFFHSIIFWGANKPQHEKVDFLALIREYLRLAQRNRMFET